MSAPLDPVAGPDDDAPSSASGSTPTTSPARLPIAQPGPPIAQPHGGVITPWLPGASGNPGGRAKAAEGLRKTLRRLAGGMTGKRYAEALMTLALGKPQEIVELLGDARARMAMQDRIECLKLIARIVGYDVHPREDEDGPGGRTVVVQLMVPRREDMVVRDVTPRALVQTALQIPRIVSQQDAAAASSTPVPKPPTP